MTPTLLDQYHALERTSRDMLSAAQRQKWDEVTLLEATSRKQIAQLKQKAAEQQLSPEQTRQKQRLLLAILRHDAMVRSLAEPSIAGVDLLFHRSGPAQRH